MFKKYKLLIILCGLVSNLFSAVNDFIPSDYESPLANTSVVSLNYLTKELSTSKLSKEEYIKQNTYILRYTYGFNIDGKILALGFALPFSDLKTHGDTLSSYIGEKATGLSDTVLSTSYWLVNDRKNRDFLAITMTLYTPNGEYKESQLLNTGENRYKGTLAIGYITKLADSFLFELSPEIGFYGDNKSYYSTIEQKNSYSLSSNLRYKPNNFYELFIGFQENYQAQTIKNKIVQNEDYFYEKYSLGGAYYFNKSHQIMFRIAQEDDKEYGFEANKESLLRYRYWF